jgi:ABC-type transport system substrate-binding protein
MKAEGTISLGRKCAERQHTPTTAASAPTNTPATAASTTNTDVNTFVEAQFGDVSSTDPAWEYDNASGEVTYNVYETLVFLNKDKVDQFVPMLATKWDVSPDGKTYTFKIRNGVTFQHGQPLTPQDAAYSLWRAMIQDRAGGPSWILLEPFFGLEVQSFQDDVVTKQFNGDFAAATTAVEQAITYDNAAGTDGPAHRSGRLDQRHPGTGEYLQAIAEPGLRECA